MRLSLLSENTRRQLDAQGYAFLKHVHTVNYKGQQHAIYEPVKNILSGTGSFEPLRSGNITNSQKRIYLCT